MTIYRDDLERVYALIEKPENWTQGHLARDADGEPVEPDEASAVCWCAIGAFQKCGVVNPDREVMWVPITRTLMPEIDVDALERACLPGGIADFNDTHTHAEALDLLRAAIARAPERPQRGEGE